MVVKTLEEIARERMNEASDAARKRFRNAVKPIYGVSDGGDPFHIGSALLLDLPEGHYLLTAAHVIDWSKSTTLFLGADHFAPLQFEALVTTPPSGDRRKDHADFSIAPLNADLVPKLIGATFVTEAEISASVASSEGRIYTCLGYPNSKNKINRVNGTRVIPSLLPYTSVGRSASCLPAIAKENHHILVDYNARHARDELGAKVSAIAVRGCSGGAIVDMGRISPDTLTADFDPKLAALFIEAHAEQKVILGTRLTVILAEMRSHIQRTADDIASSCGGQTPPN
ncbi:hypothetical protein FJ942_26355 [Mesorhizobium sp. B2-4-2]|uniref:hypothetical protein n=1 Tax=Mesorhizobium sp. B2-4-2 TaxID=2589947 RepID=UPI00112B3DD6|nr:hypothetical protein [Mesorhizobium sp. B2-4-2]TPL47996.1 hypothetical protein FJ942_26355 [Mesorhizobium sp. B2-4-2]